MRNQIRRRYRYRTDDLLGAGDGPENSVRRPLAECLTSPLRNVANSLSCTDRRACLSVIELSFATGRTDAESPENADRCTVASYVMNGSCHQVRKTVRHVVTATTDLDPAREGRGVAFTLLPVVEETNVCEGPRPPAPCPCSRRINTVPGEPWFEWLYVA
jgi:hypothetical protein